MEELSLLSLDGQRTPGLHLAVAAVEEGVAVPCRLALEAEEVAVLLLLKRLSCHLAKEEVEGCCLEEQVVAEVLLKMEAEEVLEEHLSAVVVVESDLAGYCRDLKELLFLLHGMEYSLILYTYPESSLFD